MWYEGKLQTWESVSQQTKDFFQANEHKTLDVAKYWDCLLYTSPSQRDS